MIPIAAAPRFCGLLSLTDAPIEPSLLEHLRVSCGQEQPQVWAEGPIAIAAARGELLLPDKPQHADDAVLVVRARLDPPFDSVPAADSDHRSGQVTDRAADARRVQTAYRRRGEGAAQHLFGDWLFTAWHAREQRLVLARDQVGASGLYYYADARWFAFASDVAALGALPFVPDLVDDVWLAESLFGWTDLAMQRTSRAGVRRIPPGHLLTLVGGRPQLRCYWDPNDIEVARLPSSADYAMQLREVLTAAVASRLPATGKVASHLSGGMDSGSVALLAAGLLAPEGRSLHAFTASTPGSYEPFFAPGTLTEEWPLAAATAAAAANITQRRVGGEAFTPVGAIRRWLEPGSEPIRNPSNLAWILAINESAEAAGCSTLLTGSLGNLTISWGGPHTAALSPSTALRRRIAGRLPAGVHTRLKGVYHPRWYRECAIHPRLLRSPGVQTMLADQREAPDDPDRRRHRALLRTAAGAASISSQGRSHGIDILDPTADVRVVEFTLSIPPHEFVDPATGMRRWPIREATKGLLPEQVRLNQRTGRQGANLVPRLRASSAEVTDALRDLATGPAADYVDVAYLTRSWAYIQSHDDPESFVRASRVLTRGLLMGMYVNAISR